ncbi:MAG: hypothetical protein JWP44_2201 [Mucilaginibacter sp.]|nr:hypothetical protein [Mucilaginibacter sp.]
MLKNILIIDDDEDILTVIENVLTYNKFKVSAIQRTDDILKEIEKYKPDLILTDFLLSGMDGGKICQIIKKNPQTCHIPVILISGYKDLALSYGNFGFDAFLNKPFDIKLLLNTIKDCLDKADMLLDK